MDRAIAFGAISWGFESLRTRAPLVQLAEHLTLNQRVEGSIPSRRIGSKTERMPELPPLFRYSLKESGIESIFGLLHRCSGNKGGCWNLVDRIDLGSIGVTPREGSSPSSPTYISKKEP